MNVCFGFRPASPYMYSLSNNNVEQIRHRRVFVAGSGRGCEVQNQRRVTVAPPTPLQRGGATTPLPSGFPMERAILARGLFG